jgi:hypothetical protein
MDQVYIGNVKEYGSITGIMCNTIHGMGNNLQKWEMGSDCNP